MLLPFTASLPHCPALFWQQGQYHRKNEIAAAKMLYNGVKSCYDKRKASVFYSGSQALRESEFEVRRHMWVCPKCGREFKRTNQGHYCGKAPETVLEYIESQPAETRSHLKEMADIIRNCTPGVREYILWSMPTYEKEGKSISFSACKAHISLYMGIDIIANFNSALGEFTTKKNAVYFPYGRDLPAQLIETLVKSCLN